MTTIEFTFEWREANGRWHRSQTNKRTLNEIRPIAYHVCRGKTFRILKITTKTLITRETVTVQSP